jgi:hypothetical protein
MTGQSLVVNHVPWPFWILSRQKNSKQFYHEVLEDSIQNRISTLKDRDQLLSFLLSFLKIVVNSMLA